MGSMTSSSSLGFSSSSSTADTSPRKISELSETVSMGNEDYLLVTKKNGSDYVSKKIKAIQDTKIISSNITLEENCEYSNSGATQSYTATLPDGTSKCKMLVRNVIDNYQSYSIGIFHFNNNATDSSNVKTDGTLAGNASYSTTTKLGSHSLSLDGTDSYFNLATRNPFPASIGTFNCWAKNTGTDYTFPSSQDTFFAKGADNDNSNICFQFVKVDATSANILLVFHHASETTKTYALTNFDFSQWHMFTLAMGNNEQKIYVDGSLVATFTMASFTVDASLGFRIGAQPRDNPYDYEFQGYIDEVGMWSYQLSASEIADLYNNTAGKEAGTYPITLTPASGKQIKKWTTGANHSIILSEPGQTVELDRDSNGDWWPRLLIGSTPTEVAD